MLVIDDDADIRLSIADALCESDYRVEEASHGASALALLRSGLRPSLILLDLMMPVMGGEEFREHQMRDPVLAAIPVVVLTAGGPIVPILDGVSGWLVKPIHLSDLLSVVKASVSPQSTS